MNDGWIKLYRKIFDNPYYFSEKFCRSMAWIDLLLLANHNQGFFFKRGIKIKLKSGQLGYDIDSLAKRWGWSRGKVGRWFYELEKDGQIVMQKSNVTTIISIVNYSIYQGCDKASGKANRKPNSKPNGHEQEVIDKSITREGDWKSDYNIYKENCSKEFKKLSQDEDLRIKVKSLFPKIDFEKSLAKSFLGYWITEDGWNNKRKSDSATINWKATIIKTINNYPILL
jgi:hypothetical protein